MIKHMIHCHIITFVEFHDVHLAQDSFQLNIFFMSGTLASKQVFKNATP